MISEDIRFLVTESVICVFLWIMSGVTMKYRNTKFRLFWFIPPVLALLMAALYGIEKCMIPAYIGSAILLSGIISENLKFRRILSCVSLFLIIISVPVCSTSDKYRKMNYAHDFKEGFIEMKSVYTLADYKQIDMDKLFEKYYPKFEEVTDDEENYLLWNEFCAEFHDGHVSYKCKETIAESAMKKAAGNDYGLVIMTLADGRTVAVNTDKSLEKYGIHNGTEIICWNGKTPAEADKDSRLSKVISFADIDNEKFYSGIFSAGTGEDNVEVIFINDSGNEETVILEKLSTYYIDRFDSTFKILNHNTEKKNLRFEKINDDAAVMAIRQMIYDTNSKHNEDYTEMKKTITEQVNMLKEQGVKKIILDLRGNPGGSAIMARSIAELFAPLGEHYHGSAPVWDYDRQCYARDDEGNYIKDRDILYTGEHIQGDIKVYVLVNSASGSAADHLAQLLRVHNEITVLGFTEPSGSAQQAGMISVGNGILNCSVSVILNQDGEIFIDAGADRQSGNGVSIKVPLDETAIDSLFNKNEDYLLNYVLNNF